MQTIYYTGNIKDISKNKNLINLKDIIGEDDIQYIIDMLEYKDKDDLKYSIDFDDAFCISMFFIGYMGLEFKLT